MARLTLIVTLLILWALPAAATPVNAVLTGSDGSFSFSVVHDSTGGNDGQSGSILDNITLGGAGGDAWVSGSLLNLNVELVIGGGTYDVVGVFDYAGLLDDSAQLDQLLGTLSLTSVSGDTSYDGLTFYMEDRNYSSASMPPNTLDGVVLSLWGATAYNTNEAGVPVIGEHIDLITGGTGIDLRLQLTAPVPEPGAMLCFVASFVIVEVTRRKKALRHA